MDNKEREEGKGKGKGKGMEGNGREFLKKNIPLFYVFSISVLFPKTIKYLETLTIPFIKTTIGTSLFCILQLNGILTQR